MRREPIALATDFDSPEIVSEVYADAQAADGDCEFIDMIEEEHCFIHRSGSHTYLNDANHCCACGAPHPSTRTNACGQP